MARGLKFRIKKEEGLYYPCSENKGADQLRGNCEADLRLCFRICKTPVFSQRGSNVYYPCKTPGSFCRSVYFSYIIRIFHTSPIGNKISTWRLGVNKIKWVNDISSKIWFTRNLILICKNKRITTKRLASW